MTTKAPPMVPAPGSLPIAPTEEEWLTDDSPWSPDGETPSPARLEHPRALSVHPWRAADREIPSSLPAPP